MFALHAIDSDGTRHVLLDNGDWWKLTGNKTPSGGDVFDAFIKKNKTKIVLYQTKAGAKTAIRSLSQKHKNYWVKIEASQI